MEREEDRAITDNLGSGEREGFLEEVSFALGLKGWIGTDQHEKKKSRQGTVNTGNSRCRDSVPLGIWGR